MIQVLIPFYSSFAQSLTDVKITKLLLYMCVNNNFLSIFLLVLQNDVLIVIIYFVKFGIHYINNYYIVKYLLGFFVTILLLGTYQFTLTNI